VFSAVMADVLRDVEPAAIAAGLQPWLHILPRNAGSQQLVPGRKRLHLRIVVHSRFS
jgi:hypothetical protein